MHRQDPGTKLDRVLDRCITVGLGLLILIGFVTSYRTLRDLAASVGGYPIWLAPAVPLSFDLGIVVLSLKVVRAAREGRTTPFLRILVAALSVATVIVNASGSLTLPARLLHAIPPAMFVICFENVIITARRHALTAKGLLPAPLPRLRMSEWVLAPRTAFQHWRAMTLAGSHQGPNLRPSLTVRRETRRLAAPNGQVPALLEPFRSNPTPPYADRSAAIFEILGACPNIAASGLAKALNERGFRVSLRTAQRIMATVRPG